MTAVVFTAVRDRDGATFVRVADAPELLLERSLARELLDFLQLVHRSDGDILSPAELAEHLVGPIPVTLQRQADALLVLCDFAAEHDLLVAWSH